MSQEQTFDHRTGVIDGIPRREFELSDRPLLVDDEVPDVRFLSRQWQRVAGLKTRGNFARDFLPRIGAPVTTHTLVAMMAWMQAEGDAARFNPLNTTKHMPGSWPFNWVDVQNYASYIDGVKATAETLNYGADRTLYGYKPIRRRLRENSKAAAVLEAVEASAWGTGGLALHVLETTGWEALMTNRYLHHRLVQ
jgi:hypothetical protein